ncbi:MAG TPA: hypothetical protein VGI10_02970 [Polyangiaceae bacterium]
MIGSSLLAGCGDSDKKPEAAPSGALGKSGESCNSSADCAPPLVCFSNTCAASPTMTDGGGPAPTPRGGPGESCQAHSDCQTDLGCYNNRCAAMPDTDAGSPVMLGQRGESCTVPADCGTGLTCLPRAGSSSVCDVAKFPATPAGNKVCAECAVASDCCELPSTIETSEVISSCADLADKIKTAIGTSTCATTTDAASQRLCFIQSTYCKCATNTWDCTAGKCSYAASCKGAGGLTKQGCATVSRTDQPLFSTCDATSGKCAPAATATGCKVDDDCAQTPVTDVPTDMCTDGECACVVATGACYRKCAQDIDCPGPSVAFPGGFVCDTKNTSLCVPAPGCTTDIQCTTVNQLNDVLATCDTTTGTCKKPCTTDYDCSGSGGRVGTAVTGSLCGSDGFCTPLGACVDDNQCPGVGVSLDRRQFCVDASSAPATAVYRSAVTGGQQ